MSTDYDTPEMDKFQRVALILIFGVGFAAALAGQRGFLWAVVLAVVLGFVINLVRTFWNV